MYDQMEIMYKKNSLYNKFTKTYFSTAITIYIIFIILGLYKIALYGYLFLPIFMIVMYIKVYKALGLSIKNIRQIFKIGDNISHYREYVKEKDNKLGRKIVKKLNIRTKNDLKLVIEHYRELSNVTVKKLGYVNFLGLVITLAVAFKDVTGLSFSSLESSITYLLSIIIFFTIIYFSYIQVANLCKLLKGEDNLYKNLEEILTEIYLNFKKK